MQTNAMLAVKWLFFLCSRHKWQLWGAVLLASISSAFALAPIYFIYLIIDSLIDYRLAEQPIWHWVGAAMFFMLVRYLCLFGSAALAHRSAYHIQYQVRKLAVAHLAKVSLGFFTEHSSGEIKKVMAEDIERIELFVAHQIPDFVTAIVTPLVSFSFLLFIDYRMALVALIPIPLAIFSQALLYRDFAAKAEEYHNTLGELNSSVTEYARAMPIVRMFNAGDKQNKKLSDSLNAYRDLMGRWTAEAGWPFAAFKVLLDSGLVILVPVGLYLWVDGSLGIAAFVLSILLGVGMMEPLYNLSLLSAYLNQIFGGVTRLRELLDMEVSDDSQPEQPLAHFGVCFDNVSFSYQGASRPAIQAVSFEAKPGTITAVVGPSGAGKSTLAMLIARFWQAQSGEIRIGDTPISSIPTTQLMESVSFVFQDTFLFKQSVRDNLTMGKSYDDAEIIRAAKAACAHDFISQLPDGYDTVVGIGIQLSGGERQRIAIARAALKDAPILLLDEPTAFADASSQKIIHQALGNLIQNKTVFVIAHRLSTIVSASQILVLKDGLLVEQGSHNELIEKQDIYYRMWAAHQDAQNWLIPTSKEQQEVDCV